LVAQRPGLRTAWTVASLFGLLKLRRAADRRIWEHTILTAGVVAFVVFFLRHSSLIHGVEMRWLDLMALVDRPALRAPVTVVAIEDRDYYDPGLFAGLSPLHPGVLERLVRMVAAHGPSGVVFDVQIHPAPDESPDRLAGRVRLYRTLDSLARAGPTRWVLVRDLESEARVPSVPDSVRQAWEWLTTSKEIAWADPGIERPEGIARSIARQRRMAGSLLSRPTVLGAAVSLFQLKPIRSAPRWDIEEDSLPPWRIRFTRCFVDDTARVSPERVTADALLSSPPLPGRHTLLTDRIVFVGGTYRDGRDEFLTPVGEMPGVCFWAEAVASWIRHDALREPPPQVVLLLEFLVGVLTGYLLLRAGPGLGLLLSVILITPLTVVFSILAFGDRVLFVDFLPAFLGVYLHYQVELHFRLQRQSRLILELKARMRCTARRLARAREAATTVPPVGPGGIPPSPNA
jgi:CHASE2 domain-containing sensor protein